MDKCSKLRNKNQFTILLIYNLGATEMSDSIIRI